MTISYEMHILTNIEISLPAGENPFIASTALDDSLVNQELDCCK